MNSRVTFLIIPLLLSVIKDDEEVTQQDYGLF